MQALSADVGGINGVTAPSTRRLSFNAAIVTWQRLIFVM